MPSAPFTTLISAVDLTDRLDSVKILDCRAQLGNPTWGRGQFLTGHIAGAQYANLDEDLAVPPNADGRHPLPDRTLWAKTIGSWGIRNDHQVVVYDDAGGPYAARAWWMFRWAGHAAVAVLDGGLAAWLEHAGETALVAGASPTPSPAAFRLGEPLTRLAATQDVLENIAASPPERAMLDARTEARYAGREEPIDPVAGHIPGAHCRPFTDNLDARGRFKSPTELRAEFDALPIGLDEVICYCGSGVTAAHNLLALRIAGFAEPTLYAASWSGWITDRERPVATAD